MKTPGEIYAAYKIMPFLQLHQLRVAAVAKTILAHIDAKLDERNVLLACLFHDMGNIIKSDLALFPDAVEPEGLAYWEKVKADFLRRYGTSAHHGTIAICHELHLPLQSVQYIDQVGFSRLEATRDSHSIEQKIVQYADTRVAPRGIASQTERLEDARIRYEKRPGAVEGDRERFAQLVAVASEIEQQIFSKARIRPEEITDASVAPFMATLREFPAM